ncbi:unnamed protein product [Merluccius merluccius]
MAERRVRNPELPSGEELRGVYEILATDANQPSVVRALLADVYKALDRGGDRAKLLQHLVDIESGGLDTQKEAEGDGQWLIQPLVGGCTAVYVVIHVGGHCCGHGPL